MFSLRKKDTPAWQATALVILCTAFGLFATSLANAKEEESNLKKTTTIVDTALGLFKDDESREQEWKHMINAMDQQVEIAPPGTPYGDRLERLTAGLKIVEGIRFNYRVYKSSQVNAFALGTGDVRVFSGLMDLMDDEQLTFIIGHEIGHVLSKHSLKGSKRKSFLKAGLAVAGHTTKDDQTQKAVEIGAVLTDRTFSRGQEIEADKWGLSVLEHKQMPLYAAVTTMHRFGEVSGMQGDVLDTFLSTHPHPLKRAKILKKAIPESELPKENTDPGVSLKKYGE